MEILDRISLMGLGLLLGIGGVILFIICKNEVSTATKQVIKHAGFLIKYFSVAILLVLVFIGVMSIFIPLW